MTRIARGRCFRLAPGGGYRGSSFASAASYDPEEASKDAQQQQKFIQSIDALSKYANSMIGGAPPNGSSVSSNVCP